MLSSGILLATKLVCGITRNTIMIDFQALIISCIFIALGVAITEFLRLQTKVDMSRGYTRDVPRYNQFTCIILPAVISLFFMFAVYCIYKFFQFVITIL